MTLPAGVAPSGTVPAGAVPAAAVPAEAVSAEAVATETAPTEAVPTKAATAGTLPAGTVLSGIAASAGRARGTARVIHHPREANRLQPGDILVTRATDPGWTPLFPLVGGVVLEVGGLLSHGAIVAREYGIPAVINVPGATQRIPDGQVVTVDGTAGRVYPDHAPATTVEIGVVS